MEEKCFRVEDFMDAPLFLYVGCAAQTMDELEVLKELPLTCILTTQQKKLWEYISSHSNKKVYDIQTVEDFKSHVLSRNNVMISHMNGSEDDDLFESLDIRKKTAIRRQRNLLMKTIIDSMNSTLGNLIVIGYDPKNPNEIKLEDLYDQLRLSRRGSVYWFDIEHSKVETTEEFQALKEDLIVQFYSKDISEAFLIDVEDDTDTDFDFAETFTDIENTLYVENKRCSLDLNTDAITETQAFAQVLTAQTMDAIPIPSDMRSHYLGSFLRNSTETPQWYGYGQEPLYAKRTFESVLYDTVIKQLKAFL